MRLWERPDWRPLSGELTWGPWRIAVWSEPRLPDEWTADPVLVFPAGAKLRLAVADPAATNPQLSTADVAWSGQLVLGAFRAQQDLSDALADAAERMCDPGRRPRLGNLLASAAAADLTVDGDIDAVRAGDGEVWVRTDAGWESLFPTDRLTADALAAFRAHPGATSTDDGGTHWQAHLDTLEAPAAWNFPPVGFESPLRHERASRGPVREVIVSTDGAMLTPERCEHLAGWLSTGIQGVATAPHPSSHGDLAVLHARLVPAGERLVHCLNCGVRLVGESDWWVDVNGEICCERPDPR